MKILILTAAASLLLTALCAEKSPQDRSGRAPYGAWKHGPPSDPGYFPIAVWLQNPANASRYKAAGINLYVGLWQGPTEEQLAALKRAGMPVICDQNAVGLKHRDDSIIVGWMHGDEPDNAQPVYDPQTGKQTGWGPCVPPAKIVEEYRRLRQTDPSRPILLNLGQGVANDSWIGRGPGAKLSDYETYVQGCDIVSFDVYPAADGYPLWYVPKGVERLVKWSQGKKPVWNCIECTRINHPERKATPEQVRAQVWMALIHGSRGLIYFVHSFQPQFNEHALLDDPQMLAAVTALNRQIHALAPVLNSPTLAGVAEVKSSAADAPIACMAKRLDGATYLFAAGMRDRAARGQFTVTGLPARASAEVLGEGRTIPVLNGRFEDDFPPHGVHLYRIR